MKPESRSTPFIIVIDTLGECNDEKDIELILDLLKQAKDLSNAQLRIFISGRPKSHIRIRLSDVSVSENFDLHKVPSLGDASVYKNLNLHKIPSDTIEHDIFVFFKIQAG